MALVLRVLFALALMLPAWGAWAGPWPRAVGTTFSALGGNVALFQAERPIHYDPTYYLEYGLTPQITVGVEGYSADKGYAITELMFLRYPLAEPLAASLALGAIQLGQAPSPDHVAVVARLGLHWGRSIPDGWLTMDFALLDDFYRESAAGKYLHTTFRQAKVDATWGRNFNEDWQGMLQLQAGYGLNGDFYAKIAPSVAYRLSGRFKLRTGYAQALTGDHGAAVNAELWVEF